MLRRCAQEEPRRWDTILTPLLFALRDALQESTQYSLFQLVYGHSPRGLLQIVREEWERPVGLGVSAERYREELQDRISRAQRIARRNLRDVQGIQERRYNEKTRTRTFQSGDKVLVSLPTSSSKQLAVWQGPFTVVRQVGPVDYELLKPGHRRERQIYHVNLLKEWKTPQGWMALDEDTKEDLGPPCPGLGRPWEEGSVQMGKELGNHQQQELLALIEEFRAVFQEVPGRVTGVEHEIRTPQGALVRERWRPIPQWWQQEIRQEIMKMQEQGIIRLSRSPWRSPIVPVIKLDGSLRICIDYRKLNALITFDAFPMPHVTHLIEKIGEAQYITMLDLAKKYWQIPMHSTDCAKTAFRTPWGLFEFTRMPFGLNGAAATFQRLMDNL
ncbi:hypothetical protein Y1Q_0007949 [Alligator mississippiensis]|uniref:ribonuclease H n=1 Tax=Alligator mississippiensis TaxID=8496 RepID=A0A151NEZ3_ALLMI|nr:hypothetical protein Y1Q_0007949 [Alligator mississippiensis]